MSDYGYGISYTYGLSRGRWSYARDWRLVAETIIRIWRTPTGSVPWAPSVGGDLDELLNATDDSLNLVPARLEAAALADERVDSCEVTTTFQDERLTLTALVTLVEGETFRLVARAGEAAVMILEGR